MRYFLSLIWVSLTLLLVFLVNFYLRDIQNTKESFGHKKLHTQCLKWSEPSSNKQKELANPTMQKLCVHCLDSKSINEQIYEKPLFKFNLTSRERQNYQPFKTSNKLSLIKLDETMDFSCQQYLSFVDIQKTLQSKQVSLEDGQNASKILRLLQADIIAINNYQNYTNTNTNTIVFEPSNYKADKYVIFQAIERASGQVFPFNPSQVTVNYLRKDFFKINFKKVYNRCLFGLILLGVLVFILQKRRHGIVDNYVNLFLGTFVIYFFFYLYYYNIVDNVLFYPVVWAAIIWNCLIKLNNVDKNSFNFKERYYLLISVCGGGMVFLSRLTGNILIQTAFWSVFLLSYLIIYKVIVRTKYYKKRFENDSTLSTLVYLIIIKSLILETSIIEYFYGTIFLKQIEISRYTYLLVVPLVLIVMTFCQNDQKIQKFQEYTEKTQDNEQDHLNTQQNTKQNIIQPDAPLSQ